MRKFQFAYCVYSFSGPSGLQLNIILERAQNFKPYVNFELFDFHITRTVCSTQTVLLGSIKMMAVIDIILFSPWSNISELIRFYHCGCHLLQTTQLMTVSDVVSCCPKGVFAICGGQKLTVAYRFFTSFSVFGRTEAGQCWALVNSKYVSGRRLMSWLTNVIPTSLLLNQLGMKLPFNITKDDTIKEHCKRCSSGQLILNHVGSLGLVDISNIWKKMFTFSCPFHSSRCWLCLRKERKRPPPLLSLLSFSSSSSLMLLSVSGRWDALHSVALKCTPSPPWGVPMVTKGWRPLQWKYYLYWSANLYGVKPWYSVRICTLLSLEVPMGQSK